MTKLYHCRVNMLFVRRDGPFLPEELQTLSAMTQAVVDAVGKRHDGTFRCYVEVEPRIRQLALPLRWKKPKRIFVNALSDLFHEHVLMAFIAEVFAVMALTPRHTYQV